MKWLNCLIGAMSAVLIICIAVILVLEFKKSSSRQAIKSSRFSRRQRKRLTILRLQHRQRTFQVQRR